MKPELEFENEDYAWNQVEDKVCFYFKGLRDKPVLLLALDAKLLESFKEVVAKMEIRTW